MKHFTFCIVAIVVLSGCGGQQSPAPVTPTPSPQSQAPSPQFFGDACEYSKRAFMHAFAEYQKHQGNSVLLQQQQQARLAMESLCDSGDEKDSGVWACAEGHSCR